MTLKVRRLRPWFLEGDGLGREGAEVAAQGARLLKGQLQRRRQGKATKVLTVRPPPATFYLLSRPPASVKESAHHCVAQEAVLYLESMSAKCLD